MNEHSGGTVHSPGPGTPAAGPTAPSVGPQGALSSGLTIVGGLLVAVGAVRFLLVLEVLPAELGDALTTWWPALVLVAGLWLVAAGRRLLGALTTVIGALLLAPRVIPDGYTLPAVLIVVGLVLLLGAGGGRRWAVDRQRVVAFFEDRSSGQPTARSYVAVFGEAEGRLDPSLAGDGPVECLAVFGDVTVVVPPDVQVLVAQTAVLGDVRTPPPPSAPVQAVVPVRATAVFGDVRFVRG